MSQRLLNASYSRTQRRRRPATACENIAYTFALRGSLRPIYIKGDGSRIAMHVTGQRPLYASVPCDVQFHVSTRPKRNVIKFHSYTAFGMQIMHCNVYYELIKEESSIGTIKEKICMYV